MLYIEQSIIHWWRNTDSETGRSSWISGWHTWLKMQTLVACICFVNIPQIGSGVGPTQEFFATVSQELQRTGHYLWRGDAKSDLGTASVLTGFSCYHWWKL